MRRIRFGICAATLVIALAGCESHQGKINELQKEHDRLSQEYKRDCASEYLRAKPQFSQKCIDEAKQMDQVWKQIQAEKAK